jgi:hypothetical protein
MSNIRIGVLPLSHPTPQVSVSIVPSKSLVQYQALGLYRTQDSVSPEQDSADELFGINLCKQVKGSLNCDNFFSLVTPNRPR